MRELLDQELHKCGELDPVLRAIFAHERRVEVDIPVEGYAGDVDEGVLCGVVVDCDGGGMGEAAMGEGEEEVLIRVCADSWVRLVRQSQRFLR